MLLFSRRLHAELLFKKHCEYRGVANCPSNFLSWLEASEDGKQVIKDMRSKRSIAAPSDWSPSGL